MKKVSPLNKWLSGRGTGALLHPTSLPGDYGIGNLGKPARAWVDCLAKSGIHYWQICPLGPTGYGDSPYQCYSAFAGNLFLLDWGELVKVGLCQPRDLKYFRELSEEKCDFEKLLAAYKSLRKIIEANWPSFCPEEGFQSFYKENESWLRPYCYFRALKTNHNEKCWVEWPTKFRLYEKLNWSKLPKEVVLLAEVEAYLQYKFFEQWDALKEYANEKEVKIIGDIPIYVAYDSADLWSERSLFDLNKNGTKKTQAGVPPDYFSATGQLWGNPLYRWDEMKADGYAWWMKRFEQNFKLFDLVRVDHFRAFESYWSVSAKDKTAEKGEWLPGPGLDFFSKLNENFPDGKVIAEDLGVITPEVRSLCNATGYPGMAVLHFGFSQAMDSEHLLHNVDHNTLLYAGTHDNDTTVGWYRSLPDFEQDLVRRYFGISGQEVSWDLIRAMYQSVSALVVLTAQDLLSLGTEARFNFPGQALGNWSWRMTNAQMERVSSESSEYLSTLAFLYGRK